MTDLEFTSLMKDLGKYLDAKKEFTESPERIADVRHATEIARELFPKALIYIKDDPIQMGALILYIEDYYFTFNTKRETELFAELVSKATNYEFYPVDEDKIAISVLFQKALTVKLL